MARSPYLLCSATLLLTCSFAHAQIAAAPPVDLGITFSAQRSLQVNTSQNFWAEGGSVELGSTPFHGFGLAANISAVHTSDIGSTGTPLSLVTETFGPRYRWHESHRISLFGEGLFGEANAFNSLFPAAAGPQSDGTSLALRVGGGLDLRISHHWAIRALDAMWLRTQLPNSTVNAQNNLLLGAGLVLRSR